MNNTISKMRDHISSYNIQIKNGQCPWDNVSLTPQTSPPMYGRVFCILCQEWCTKERLLS